MSGVATEIVITDRNCNNFFISVVYYNFGCHRAVIFVDIGSWSSHHRGPMNRSASTAIFATFSLFILVIPTYVTLIWSAQSLSFRSLGTSFACI